MLLKREKINQGYRDNTTEKLMSSMSVWKSHRPNSFKKAIEKIDALMDSLDEQVALKAAITTVEHHKGKAHQSVDLSSSDGSMKTIQPIIVDSKETKDKIEKILSGELKRK